MTYDENGDPMSDSGWEKRARTAERERFRLERIVIDIDGHASEVRKILRNDSQAIGKSVAMASEMVEAVRDLSDKFDKVEEVLTELRVHCGISSSSREDGSGDYPRLPSGAYQPIDEKPRPGPWAMFTANPWVLVVIVCLLGVFALVGVRLSMPGLLSVSPPSEPDSVSAPSPSSSPSSSPSEGEDDAVIVWP